MKPVIVVLAIIGCAQCAKLDHLSYLPPDSRPKQAEHFDQGLSAPAGQAGSSGGSAGSQPSQPGGRYPSPTPSAGQYGSPSPSAPSGASGAASGSPSPSSSFGKTAYAAQPAGPSGGYSAQNKYASAPQNQIPILKLDTTNNGDGNYHTEYETGNGIQAEETGENQGDTSVVQGSFSYTSPEGEKIGVSYTADEDGYHPQGDNLPTPPPIPEAILKSIEYNNAHPEEGNDDGSYKAGDSEGPSGQQGAAGKSQHSGNSNQYLAPRPSGANSIAAAGSSSCQGGSQYCQSPGSPSAPTGAPSLANLLAFQGPTAEVGHSHPRLVLLNLQEAHLAPTLQPPSLLLLDPTRPKLVPVEGLQLVTNLLESPAQVDSTLINHPGAEALVPLGSVSMEELHPAHLDPLAARASRKQPLPVPEIVVLQVSGNMDPPQAQLHLLAPPVVHLALVQDFREQLLWARMEQVPLGPINTVPLLEQVQDPVGDLEVALLAGFRPLLLPHNIRLPVPHLTSTNMDRLVLHPELILDILERLLVLKALLPTRNTHLAAVEWEHLLEQTNTELQVLHLDQLVALQPLHSIRLPAQLPDSTNMELPLPHLEPVQHLDFLDHLVAPKPLLPPHNIRLPARLLDSTNMDLPGPATASLNHQEFQVVFPLLLSLLTVAMLGLPVALKHILLGRMEGPQSQEPLPSQVPLGTNINLQALLLVLPKEVLHLARLDRAQLPEGQADRENLVQDFLGSMSTHPELPVFKPKMQMVVISIKSCFCIARENSVIFT
ncbi:hypothetical protein HUJ04_008854 [Dendroctonus ponderosae]|nr:hypothetical protein HUJ04_008854 [Dendroctonus ponderosae]